MPLQRFTARDFRCLADVGFEPDPAYTLIHGRNASGKTSLLEAVGYLGRGRSFRAAPTSALVRHGQDAFVLFGRVQDSGHVASIGVRNGRESLEVRIDGESAAGTAALVTALPLQVIDPDVHDLVAGGPEERRRFVDWIAFHVEPGFLDLWRRFRRTLKQRNAALREGVGREVLASWDREFIDLGEGVDRARRRVLEQSMPALREQGSSLLGAGMEFEYVPGWSRELALDAALSAGLERDRAQGATQAGPHRADLKLLVDERQARRLVSRGQQKLLACAMVLGAVETAQRALGRPLLLLLDDPAAELDREALERLLIQVFGLGSQVIATALRPDVLHFPSAPALFHVEQGRLTRES